MFADANSDEHYRPGYNPEFVRKVIAKRVRDAKDRADAEAKGEIERIRAKAAKIIEEKAEVCRQLDLAKHESEALKAQLLSSEMENTRLLAEKDAAEKVSAHSRALEELANLNRHSKPKHTFADIEARALKVFRLRRKDIRGDRRQRELVLARQFIMYWTARLTEMSYPMIGRLMGGKDHTTILHGKDAYARKRAAMGRNLRKAR